MKIKPPSPAMIVALIALFAALGGTGYALSDHNAVTSRAKRPLSVTALVKKDVAAYFKAHAAHLRGARGLTGLMGAQGQPGAPGTAVAYAHVNADGSVDGPNSKNVTALSHPSSGQYCLRVTGTLHNVVVTPATATGISIGDTQGTPYVDLTAFTGCPAGTNLHVVMGRLSGSGTSDWAFYMAVN